MFQVYIFPTLCPTCPVREILFSNVFPSVYSGCGENNMAASQGRLVGFRGLHSTRCLRTTNKQTVQSAISKGIGAKECRRTFFTSILRQGKALQKHQTILSWLASLPSLTGPDISFDFLFDLIFSESQ